METWHGDIKKSVQNENISLSHVQYEPSRADWHYHENAFFSFIVQGQILEGTKKEKHCCTPGTLLFQNWDDPHYNICQRKSTQSFYLELKKAWVDSVFASVEQTRGSFVIKDPEIKLLFHQLYKESKQAGTGTVLGTEALTLQILGTLASIKRVYPARPSWPQRLKEMLYDMPGEVSLDALSAELGLHPVYLCQAFPVYFRCTLSQYLRKIKVEKSLGMLSDKAYPLHAVAYSCGFADQSHFIRCFKEITSITPLQYRKILLKN